MGEDSTLVARQTKELRARKIALVWAQDATTKQRNVECFEATTEYASIWASYQTKVSEDTDVHCRAEKIGVYIDEDWVRC